MRDPVCDQRAKAARCDHCGGPLTDGECGCLLAVERFGAAMRRELQENASKGGRCGDGGWVRGMTPEQRVSELLYHCAKVAYAQRQFLQGDGEAAKVVEFAADVGNCALMIVDGLNLLGIAIVGEGRGVSGDERQPDARLREALERIAYAQEFPGDEKGALEGCRNSAREALAAVPSARAESSRARTVEECLRGWAGGSARASTPEDEPRGDEAYENGRGARAAGSPLRANPETSEARYARWSQGWLDEHHGKPRVVAASTGTEDAREEARLDATEAALSAICRAKDMRDPLGAWQTALNDLWRAALAAARPVEDAPTTAQDEPEWVHPDGTSWPVPHAPSEHALRYGGEPHRGHTAAVLLAYAHLLDPAITLASAVESLRRARLAIAARPVTGTKEER